MADPFAVTNQAPPLQGVNFFTRDRALGDALRPFAALDDDPGLTAIGDLAGTQEALSHALPANQNPPVLRTHDRYGNRIDEVEFHPSWHWLMEKAVGFGLQAAPWTSDRPAPHLTRAAGFYLWSQVEPGHGCPISMTYAAVPALRASEELAAEWIPSLAATSYDARRLRAGDKAGALAGMGMTEKQGGSDVRANLTTATPSGSDGEYLLNGHKWFCSAPQVDVFLVLAQAPDGLTCFVVPRVLADGNRNAFALQRLKEKLGNRSNASSEVEFHGTIGYRLGDEGAGVRTIIEMVAATRLDCVLGSSALMRRALVEATWHTSHRSAFGGLLRDKPAMQNVLADLALESEAATALSMRLAAAVDASLGGDEQAAAFRRIALPLAKFWVCKRTSMTVAEALECLGGNGYVEESGLPLLFRESPLNSIWEGSGTVNALDVLRALRRPESLDAWLTEVGAARGADRRLDAAITGVLESLADLSDAEAGARRLAARMAVCLQASLLVRYSTPEVADAFVASRLGADWGGVFGTLPRTTPFTSIVDRIL
ncbi:putative acyl-CoA dehydrogenase [Kribbella orskensis]|uniref:Acyl-CoA dehydrogenase n=1 Tax=Kribbella orskensis TaxID=2512216 RepID=A0ABY2BGG2_9ACTN|nr:MULTISPECIES: acyl-CoA dehydrogenase family protein [Kribbella]TCN37919.1 putative acyl-CoA dehydrogenase [Kribbella sp. VKM Ac-2500]TCO19405.1 putative acyl-CoA dehydrogenase [Kribbella orskensis]